mmetsp:Transcript_18791/g.51450  ORF Transcript_18791/g.51450 Transcript_18791/m.51450 type:complete len:262 (+) Transcript_18791:3239-4024(+)
MTGLNRMCAELSLTDLLFRHTGQDDFNTFIAGTERIDYCFCSDWVADACMECCYEPFKYRGNGHHRGIALDFSTTLLFGNENHKLAAMANREFNSKDAKRCRQYCEHKYDYLTEHNFEARLVDVETTWNADAAETLNRDFQRSSQIAAKKCQKKPNPAYSRKLSTLRAEKNLLMRVISTRRMGRAFNHSTRKLTSTGTTLLIPSTLEECTSLLKQKQREIYNVAKQASFHREHEMQSDITQATAKGDKQLAKQKSSVLWRC